MKVINNKLKIISIFFIINSCSNFQNSNVDLSSFESLFVSLNEIKDKKKTSIKNSPLKMISNKNNVVKGKKTKTNKKRKRLPSNGSSIENKKNQKKIKSDLKIVDLKKKRGTSDIELVKLIGKPSFEIKKGKVKVLQFHLKSCYLDLFFILDNSSYLLDHLEYRSPEISKKFDKKKCDIEINKKINSEHHLK